MSATLLVDADQLAGSELEVAGEDFHHLFRVRRLSAGEALRLVDGEGRARWGEVTDVSRKRALVQLGDPAPANEPEIRVELVVGALRRERASWLVEKATELGAAAVRFLASDRAPRQFGAATFARLRRVSRSALEQCGRSRLPELTGVHDWSEIPDLIADLDQRWLLDVGEATARLEKATAPAVLFVGPEGGWSTEEREGLAAIGCLSAGLGARVLRVETAATVGLGRLLIG